MNTILLIITLLSAAAAIVTGAAAWRLARDERARSSARIAALTAAADRNDDETDALDPWRLNQPAGFTPPSLTTTEGTSVEAPWAPARVSSPPDDSFLGSSLVRPSSAGQRGLAIAAAVLFVTILVGGYFTLFGGSSPAATAAGSGAPLELVSLRHERGSGGLAITGLVRNPVGGTPVQDLTAVVLLFDQAGTLVTSARTAVDFTTLAPGDESPFVVTLNAPSNVARYRVSFRNDTRVVAHIDRRGQEPIARDTP